MTSKWMLFLVLWCQSAYLLAQEIEPEPLRDRHTALVEDYLLEGKRDSARLVFNKQDVSDDYHKVLYRLLEASKASYADYLKFYTSVTNRVIVDYQHVHDFLTEVPVPGVSQREMDLDFVWLKWHQIDNASNKLLDIDLGNRLYQELSDYVNRFDANSRDFQKAEILLATHQMNLMVIKGQAEDGIVLSTEILEKARTLKDTTLTILALYHRCDFYLFEKKLMEYIEASQEAYSYERPRKKKSPYYVSNLDHLIDSKRNLTNNENELLDLLNELSGTPNGYLQSFYLYIDYLLDLPANSDYKSLVYQRFNVRSSLDLIKLMESQASANMDNLNMSRLTQRIARLLIRENHGEEAAAYMKKAIDYNGLAYSGDLGRALAKYETDLLTKENEAQLTLEKEKSRLSIVIAVLAALLMVFSLLAYNRKRLQNREIKEKSIQIAHQRDAIQKRDTEKELLLKEIHHRVKNNLQVVSSLLDLQSRGIENEEALATFTEGQNRVKAMALIHQKLYQNENLATINFEDYAKLLMGELATIYQKGNNIKTEISSDSHAEFDIDVAVPLGLILNELISNAYKYAFNDRTEGALVVSIRSLGEGKHQLTVEDNGAGLPEAFDFGKAKSLGLRLVRRLAKQLYGSVTYSYDAGAKFVIIFTDTIQRKAG